MFDLVVFLIFSVLAIGTYWLLSREVRRRFGGAVADDNFTKVTMVLLALTAPNAIATVLIFIFGLLK